MPTGLLERDADLSVLHTAVGRAREGAGSVVLVAGEAGIGKTALVRAFLAGLGRDARRLVGACDDLHTRRALGPLRDAARGTGGPLERALGDGPASDVFAAATAELDLPPVTALVVEDVHWVDDATVDVLRHLARRASTCSGVLVLTYRADEIDTGHPLRELLGELSGVRVHRVRPAPLSECAVAELAGERAAPGLYRISGGNPFFVSEAAAAPPGTVPRTVADAVLARLGRLSPACRSACEQLSVVPTVAGFDLVDALLGDAVDVLDEAERRGVLQVRDDGLAFRHELARRAVEQRLGGLRRRELNRAVVTALLASPGPDPDRVVHHAVEAGDGATIAARAPEAGRAAARVAAHRQALRHFEHALRHAVLLDGAEHARVLDEYAWELYNAHRFADAVVAGTDAVARLARLGDRAALAGALVRLSRHHYMAGDTAEAERVADRAVATASGDDRAPALAAQGSLLALTGRPAPAIDVLDRARELAGDRADVVAMCLNYRGVARTDLHGDDGLDDLRESLAVALRSGTHEFVARGYTNLAEALYRLGCAGELEQVVADGLAFTREHGFTSHAYNLDVHGCLLTARRGDWDAAGRRLRELVNDPSPGMLFVYSVPSYARLLARRGRADVDGMLDESWRRATAQRSGPGTAFAGLAVVERAWLTGCVERARPVADVLLAGSDRRGWAPVAAECLCLLRRAGVPVEPFDGCPEPWASTLRGDWRAAADAWAAAGDPYERALALADSGEPEPVLEALAVLDGLGVRAPASLLRERLTGLGVDRIPRGPTASTRTNPAGLTDRQVEVLAQLAASRTNAEIAARLGLSIRTVDHHVAAVLDKLGVRTRRDAARLAGSLDLPVSEGRGAP